MPDFPVENFTKVLRDKFERDLTKRGKSRKTSYSNFPFHKQETSWTCGPAVMRMVFENLGIKKSEKQFAGLLHSNKVRGTWQKEFPRVAEDHRFDYEVMRSAKISDLKKFNDAGYLVIVCYFIPRDSVDHYAVVRNVTERRIYFHDPWFGEGHSYSLKYFRRIWKFDPKHDKERSWFFAVKRT